MTRDVTGLVLLLAVLAVLAVLAFACDAGGSAGPASVSHGRDAPAAVVAVPRPSEVAPSATTTPPVAEPPTSERPPVVRVASRALAASWQSYLGQRVQLRCRPVRRLDFVRTLVVAEGVRFVVMGSPNVTPCGANTSTFTVMGASTVPISGRAVLPELLLEPDGGEGGVR